MFTPASVARLAALPKPLTPLIGREEEIRWLTDLIRGREVHLVTLTGPGGVGKTRLAIAAATSVVDDFRDGVAFVNLAPIATPTLVLDTIASAIGLREVGTEALRDRLIDALADRRMLLILDNFEQVVTAGPRVRDLLDACPGLTLLVTSRINLRLSGEHAFPVAPLPLSTSTVVEDAGSSGAVRLFVERARAIRPEFSLTAETLPTVAGIVSRVDGLPLAIELAAARVRALPPATLLRRLDQRLPLLSGGARDLPLRQQTMRDTIAWSYDLLAPAEQAFFTQLSVFVGGFTLEAAEAVSSHVANASFNLQPGVPLDAVEGITSLIDHSLLRQSSGPGHEPRYQILETVREFGVERLGANGDADEHAVRGAHAAWCLALSEEAEPALWGAGEGDWLDRLDREKDNLRAALHWTLSRAETETAMRLGAALWRFWECRGYVSEGRSQLDRILALSPSSASPAARCSALTGAGVLAASQGDYDQAIRCCEEALVGWRQLDDHRGIARALLCLAAVARYRDDFPMAESLGHDSLTAYRTVNDQWGIGHALSHLGMLAWLQGNHMTGITLYEEALTNLRDAGDQSGIFEILLEMGKGARDAGDLERPTSLFEECLALATSIGDRANRGRALAELGVVARLRGDHARATDLLTQATALAQETGDRRQLAYLAWYLGDVDFALDDVERAAARYAEALGLFLQMGNRVGIAQCFEKLARCGLVRGHLSSAGRLLGSSFALFSEIRVTPPPDRDPATAAAALELRLSPAEFARAWDAGRTLSLVEAAAEALAVAAELAEEEPDASPADVGMEVRAVPAGSSRPTPVEAASAAAALGLTPREVDVLRLLAQGLSDREIAAALFLSPRTVGWHVTHLLAKLEVPSRAAAVATAIRRGLV